MLTLALAKPHGRRWHYTPSAALPIADDESAGCSLRNLFLVATYDRLGRIEDAKARVAADPVPLSIDWIDYYFTYKDKEDWDHFADSFRLAGVPEVATKVPPPPKH